MLRLTGSVCIEASKEEVWNVLVDIENIVDWSEMVQSAKSSSEVSSGIGTERTCDLSSRVTITERWVAWDEGHSYTYEGFNIPLVKSAKNKWSVKTENGKTLLTTKSEIVLKGGIFGIILEPLMTLMSTKMGTNALAAFKYLVENGRPFEGKHSTLPKLPIAC